MWEKKFTNLAKTYRLFSIPIWQHWNIIHNSHERRGEEGEDFKDENMIRIFCRKYILDLKIEIFNFSLENVLFVNLLSFEYWFWPHPETFICLLPLVLILSDLSGSYGPFTVKFRSSVTWTSQVLSKKRYRFQVNSKTCSWNRAFEVFNV